MSSSPTNQPARSLPRKRSRRGTRSWCTTTKRLLQHALHRADVSSLLEIVIIDDLLVLRPRLPSQCTYGYPYEGTSRESLRLFTNAFATATSVEQHIDAAIHAPLCFGGHPILPSMLLGTIAIHRFVDPLIINEVRIHNEARLRIILDDWTSRSSAPLSQASPHWRLRNINYLVALTNYIDSTVVEDLHHGFPQIGTIPSGHLFPPAAKPKHAIGGREQMSFTDTDAKDIHRYLLRTASDDPELRQAVISDVRDECSKGRALGPFPLSTWKDHCAFCSPVFPIRQTDKIRLISNYSYRVRGSGSRPSHRHCFNDFCTTLHKVSLPRLSHVALAASMLGDEPKHISRTDLEGAYRQVRMNPTDTVYSAGIFLDSNLDPCIVIPLVLTFGAVGSVTNFLRVGELHAHIARAVFLVNAFSYLDDFFPISPPSLSASALSSIHFTMEFCTGARIKHAKDIPPATKNLLLGLIVDLSNGGFCISLDDSRRQHLIHALFELKTGHHKISSKLAGKLSFAAEAFLGRAGRGFIRSLIRSSLGLKVPRETLTTCIDSLLYMFHHSTAFTRDLIAEVRLAPRRLVCYADATGHGKLGIYLPPSSSYTSQFGVADLPVSSQASTNHINLLELLAGSAAVHTFAYLLPPGTAFMVLFLDNTVAESLIYTGSSASPRLNLAASLFWLDIATLPIYNVFVSRVGSALNPADAVSRESFSQPWLADSTRVTVALPTWANTVSAS
ncbi:hypothetical protein FOZ60_017108 [Perkinsus olseni]|uniref:Reverse transcriptase domain-containing protein n=2 Tax=Perkinsus olseni TaxID=32597 RepID=A0A7J6N2P2_PEROL|nr:hypothetical protein FOZ60_017108 [Perkinsus olseni]